MNSWRRDPPPDPVRRYLDGELELTDLAAGARPEARAWSRLLAAVRDELPGAPAPAWLEDRVMAEIGRLEEAGVLTRLWRWLIAPRPIQLRPLAVGAAAAVVGALLLLPARGPQPVAPPEGSGPMAAMAGTDPVVYVQFVLEAPGARSVAVGGDFDAWEGSHALEDTDGDGVWTGRIPLEPGVHAYMFLVDGAEWVTDPRAQRWSDDGFGNRNALLALTDPSA